MAIASPRSLPSFQRRRLPSLPPLISSPFFSSTRLLTGPWPVAIASPRSLPSFQRRRLPSLPPLISSPFFSSTRRITGPWPVAIDPTSWLKPTARLREAVRETASGSCRLAMGPIAASPFSTLRKGSAFRSARWLASNARACESRAAVSCCQANPPAPRARNERTPSEPIVILARVSSLLWNFSLILI